MTSFLKLSRDLLIYQLLLMVSIHIGVINQATAVEMVETVGRAVIQGDQGAENARMLALEEALYLAALRGGAKINGFSAIETNSAISENFVIRPASNIVDYTITKEEKLGEHYTVTILAAVGSVENVGCKVGSIINLTSYKPKLFVSGDVPSWFQSTASNIYSELISELRATENFNLISAGDEVLDINKLNSTNDAFDYTSLTTGRTRVEIGGYAVVVEINFSQEKVFKQDLIESSSDYVIMNIRSSIYEGGIYDPIFIQEDKIKVLVKKEGASRLINILSAPSKDKIIFDLKSVIPLHVEAIRSKLKCQPLMAKLSIEGERLKIKIGEKHGVKLSSLAVSEGQYTPWTLFRVSELGTNYTMLEPLDSAKDFRQMIGLKIKFLEEM